MSVAEAGDFKTIACGCPDEAGNIATPSPTAGVVGVTVAPVAAVTRVPTPALVTPTTAPIPEPALATPTTAPIPGEPALTSDATNQVSEPCLSFPPPQRRLVALMYIDRS